MEGITQEKNLEALFLLWSIKKAKSRNYWN